MGVELTRIIDSLSIIMNIINEFQKVCKCEANYEDYLQYCPAKSSRPIAGVQSQLIADNRGTGRTQVK